MSSKLILEQTLTDIADAIRSKAGTTDPINPADMPQAIEDMPSGGGDTINDVLLEGTQKEYTNNTYAGEIKSYRFVGSNVERVTLSRVTRIRNYCFADCSALVSLSLPECLETGESAVYSAQNLETVDFSKLRALGRYALYECKKLTRFDGPDIQEFTNGCMYGCSALTIVDIGRGSSLRPQSIYTEAFRECSALTAFVIRNTNGTYALGTTSAFSGTPIASGTGYIYVPRALVSTYQSATNWATFASQIRAVEDYTNDGTLTGDFVMP